MNLSITKAMNKKSFFLGFATGVILTFVSLFIIGLASQNSAENAIQYLEKPVSYENKSVTSFKVLQVLGNAALATEASDRFYYDGITVLILGKDFYSDQIVTVYNPQRVGTYSYTTKSGKSKIVPVINGN